MVVYGFLYAFHTFCQALLLVLTTIGLEELDPCGFNGVVIKYFKPNSEDN
jgi:hypothetical protein